MLKKSMRLKKTVSRRSSEFSTPYFNLRIQANKDRASRFGFVVSKKIDKRATVRNRVKRVLRSCIEENLESIKKGYDFSFILKSGAVGTNREQLCQAVFSIFNQNKLLIK